MLYRIKNLVVMDGFTMRVNPFYAPFGRETADDMIENKNDDDLDDFSCFIYNTVELIDEEVTILVNLMREHQKVTVYHINLREKHPEIFQKLYKSLEDMVHEMFEPKDLEHIDFDITVRLPREIIEIFLHSNS